MSVLTFWFTAIAPMTFGAWMFRSGLAKRRDWLSWWQALDSYRLLTPAAKPLAARGVPAMEMLIGASLWLPVVRRPGLLLAAALMLAFAVAIAGNLLKGITRFDCGCNMGARRPHGSWLLLRALLLAALALILWRQPEPTLLQYLLTGLGLGLALLLRATWPTLSHRGRALAPRR